MKRFLKEAIGFVLVKWFILTRKKPDAILSVTFHKPSRKMFKDVLSWLEKWNYRIVSLQELENLIGKPTNNGKIAFITIDDGWRSNLELLDIMEERQAPVAIFVPTEPVVSGNYWWEFAGSEGQEKITGISQVKDFKNLPEDERVQKVRKIREQVNMERSCVTLEELKILAGHKWVTIGSHTVTHPILNRCSVQQQEQELVESRRQLEEWLGKPVHYFAYPNGDFDQETIRLVNEAGYRIGFTDSAGYISLPITNPFEIPRNSLNDDHGYYENYSKLLGVWQKVFGN